MRCGAEVVAFISRCDNATGRPSPSIWKARCLGRRLDATKGGVAGLALTANANPIRHAAPQAMRCADAGEILVGIGGGSEYRSVQGIYRAIGIEFAM
jgi:hypothetical protein